MSTNDAPGQYIQGCKNKRMFANSGTLRTDSCSQELRAMTNDSYAGYNVWDPRPLVCEEANTKLSEFASCHENLHYKQGHGNVEPCHVDEDSQIRTKAFCEANKKRYQLFPREFQAGPGLARGDFLPDIDSHMTRGGIQQRDKRNRMPAADCSHLSEVEHNNNFIPMIPCLANTIQDPDHIVPKWTNGGMPSRILVRKLCDYQPSPQPSS